MQEKTKVIEAQLTAQGMKCAIVASRFNHIFVEKLVDGALDALTRHGATTSDQTVLWVPGAFEIPIVAQRVAQSRKYDAVICLGALIKGSTDHYDYIANSTVSGISDVALQTSIPVTMGILTVHTLEQAMDRSGAKVGNQGWNAAMAAIETVNVIRQIG